MRCKACDAPQCENCKWRAGYSQQNCATPNSPGIDMTILQGQEESGNAIF